jgi:hypothetical protein
MADGNCGVWRLYPNDDVPLIESVEAPYKHASRHAGALSDQVASAESTLFAALIESTSDAV